MRFPIISKNGPQTRSMKPFELINQMFKKKQKHKKLEEKMFPYYGQGC